MRAIHPSTNSDASGSDPFSATTMQQPTLKPTSTSTSSTMKRYSCISLSLGLLMLLSFPYSVTSRAILGVDLGSLYMKVALVQSGSPLEIVTNLHSKRKTEQMILFDRDLQRFYGADANALLARKSHTTPVAMSLMLGRDEQHPTVQVLAERHFPIRPKYNESRAGVSIEVDGHAFTPEELVAMVLTHAVDISVAYSAEHGRTIPPPKDLVLTVPSYATQHERRALLDAAAVADLNVLTLIEENTAAALHYAMDKSFVDNEQLLLFYNMGASSLQVSLIRFFAYDQPQKYGKPKTIPALEVLAKSWDSTLGGQAFDHVLVEYLADQFNHEWARTGRGVGKDVRQVPRAMTKLRLQANKVKHVLSANMEIPVHMDSIHDDVSLSTHITREQLETLAGHLLERSVVPIAQCLMIANKTVDDLTGIELIGGGMRIPRVQQQVSSVLPGVELGLHINADESMALGAAFAGANISTAFRVRPVGLTDINPFPMAVTLADMPADAEARIAAGEEPWSKQATIFQAFGKVGVKKTIAFTHDRDVHCSLDYVDPALVPPGTSTALERYIVSGVADFAKEMSEKGLGKPKVSLQFELGEAGIASLVKAEAAVEETYTVEEEIEVDDEEAAAAAEEGAAAPAEGENAEKPAETEPAAETERKAEETTEGSDGEAADKKENETKPAEKPKKMVKVQKEKKRTHRQPLTVQAYHEGRVQPHTGELLKASKQKLMEMAKHDKERMMLEEARNRVEAYIYRIKNKLEDDSEHINPVTTEEQREAVRSLALAAEEWLYDEGYGADLATMEDKYAELSVPFEKIWLRVEEMVARPAAMEALKKQLVDVEQLMAKWTTERPQVTEEERTSVLEKVEEVRKWIVESEDAQAKKQPHEDPAFLSVDVPKQTKSLEALVLKLSRKPKPKPPKVEKNETSDSNETAEGEAAPDAASAEDGTASASGEEAGAKDETSEEKPAEEELPEDEL